MVGSMIVAGVYTALYEVDACGYRC